MRQYTTRDLAQKLGVSVRTLWSLVRPTDAVRKVGNARVWTHAEYRAMLARRNERRNGR